LLSRRNGLDNNRHRHRMHRRLRVHQLSPVLQRNNHRVLRGNRAHRCRALPLNSRLPACRQAHRECHRRARLALLREDQLFREQPSQQH
jgi:hypothetical protein